ncbi:MAG: D-alanine-D-alanine ligase [Solirubrobacteraceae bacterium]|nr:D-alanine-D-alanine ligase [Solirubrobacteraceae bacterium]
MNVTVLCGGESLERDVSLASGHEVARSLARAGHVVALHDPAAPSPCLYDSEIDRGLVPTAPVAPAPPAAPLGPDCERRMLADRTGGETFARMARSDAVFLAFHGGRGEDGHVQALLEMGGVPFSGAGSTTCALAWDKALTLRLLAVAGIAVPAQRIVPAAATTATAAAGLIDVGPVVAKPLTGGSSVAVSVIDTAARLDEHVAGTAETLVVEEFLPGREYAVAVVDGVPLPVVEIETPEGVDIFDYASKYQPGGARETCPADVAPRVADEMISAAVEAHALLGFASAHSRSDFRCDASGRPRLLEVNALPGLTPTSLLPLAAVAHGWSYDELVTRILSALS